MNTQTETKEIKRFDLKLETKLLTALNKILCAQTNSISEELIQ